MSAHRNKDCPPDNTSCKELFSANDPMFNCLKNATLDTIHREAPICQDPNFDRLIISGHENVAKILSDPALSVDIFRARVGAYSRRSLKTENRSNGSMIDVDGEDHARLRKPFSHLFSQKSILSLSSFIENRSNTLLDELDASKSFDLIGGYAGLLPAHVIAHIFTNNESDFVKVVSWTKAITNVFLPGATQQTFNFCAEADLELRNWVLNKLDDLRSSPREENIISALFQFEAINKLSTEEIYSNLRQILAASCLTTTDLMGNGVVALLNRREELSRLLADDDLWGNAIEEILRFDPPVRSWSRQCVGTYSIGSCAVQEGQTITALILAANHDPNFYADPHAFCIDRTARKHFSFGGGSHFCLGAPLARQVSRIGLQKLFKRWPNLALLEDRKLERKVGSASSGYRAVFVTTK